LFFTGTRRKRKNIHINPGLIFDDAKTDDEEFFSVLFSI
jgi:hypothetical protein